MQKRLLPSWLISISMNVTNDIHLFISTKMKQKNKTEN